ncbi:hypothetical protein [Tumebacillus permanentifrigoris]|uniref:Uncharacterized protein n=1 Tax=Tumebacillus permanentifrigoris TaxID=378543 RepID=A0A316D6B2_9BACL|nr:hypothetical protein [Tumebacillus permanentifrigoris]PWK09644.1 hypothetical protein C7459_11378 [Tumebacillus permanentifrigoris]
MTRLRFWQRNRFVLSLLVLEVLADTALAAWDPVNKYPQFDKTDYAKILHFHPERPWKEVFFGNSAVIAGYPEQSGDRLNLGIPYGEVTDLDALLRKKLIPTPQRIVLGLNVFTLMDPLPSNPGYLWFKKPYEPYVYFYRSQLKDYLLQNGKALLRGDSLNKPLDKNVIYWRERYVGALTDAQLDEKRTEYARKYGASMTLAHDFQDNLDALQRVIATCEEQGLNLKVVWTPWNPYDPSPLHLAELQSAVNPLLHAHHIDVLDLTNAYPREDFHDLGHLEVNRGAPKFTKDVDTWLHQHK